MTSLYPRRTLLWGHCGFPQRSSQFPCENNEMRAGWKNIPLDNKSFVYFLARNNSLNVVNLWALLCAGAENANWADLEIDSKGSKTRSQCEKWYSPLLLLVFPGNILGTRKRDSKCIIYLFIYFLGKIFEFRLALCRVPICLWRTCPYCYLNNGLTPHQGNNI